EPVTASSIPVATSFPEETTHISTYQHKARASLCSRTSRNKRTNVSTTQTHDAASVRIESIVTAKGLRASGGKTNDKQLPQNNTGGSNTAARLSEAIDGPTVHNDNDVVVPVTSILTTIASETSSEKTVAVPTSHSNVAVVVPVASISATRDSTTPTDVVLDSQTTLSGEGLASDLHSEKLQLSKRFRKKRSSTMQTERVKKKKVRKWAVECILGRTKEGRKDMYVIKWGCGSITNEPIHSIEKDCAQMVRDYELNH
ncbi:hypothetical protein HDV02_004189, partial [Globomyces sp. JEL0801]